MKHATNCKFCQLPITVEVDDEYAALGDPYKLLPFAACNRCADLRVTRGVLEERVKHACLGLFQKKGKVSKEAMDRTRQMLVKLTQGYATMIARWHHKEGMAWDEECVNLLMDRPQFWNKILAELWHLFRDSRMVQATGKSSG
jgi:hypothetical protein